MTRLGITALLISREGEFIFHDSSDSRENISIMYRGITVVPNVEAKNKAINYLVQWSSIRVHGTIYYSEREAEKNRKYDPVLWRKGRLFCDR